MHQTLRVIRHLVVILTLLGFALPLAASSALPVGAQTTGYPPDTIAGVASVTPPVAFNPIGTEHTVTFTCGALAGLTGATGSALAGTGAGCYNVQASVTDITTGSAATITSSTCGGTAAGSGGGSVDCSTVFSPICPTGMNAATTRALGAAACVAPTTAAPLVPSASRATVTINPGANHAYQITFTGYVPTTPSGSCPAGTTGPTTVALSLAPTTAAAGATPIPASPACRFSVSAAKKYVEITTITLTTPTACGGSLVFAEGLKSFFGPACTVTAVVSGTVVLKTGVNCTDNSEPPNNGAAVPAEFGPNATYVCQGSTLSVTGVTGPAGGTSLAGVSLDFTGSGVGSFTMVGSLGGFCAGGTSALTSTVVTTGTGAIATLCPTGPGTASLQACLTPPLPNNQPQVCSNTISFSYTAVASRVVPYVRWAGEKIELTKCFGIGLAGFPVEFVLKGNNPGLNATLLPVGLTSLPGTTSGGVTGGIGAFPTADTIWTVTDAGGCATVLGYADGEGTMQVDAAIFSGGAPGVSTVLASGTPPTCPAGYTPSTTPITATTTCTLTTPTAGTLVGTPLVNEHAFDVFYLKFDHLDLENIKFTTYSTAQALLPYLSWAALTPALHGASTFPSSFRLPGPPGSGAVAGGGPVSVPLCSPDFVRAMVHGYFEMPGDPSGRPAATVAIPGAAAGSAGSYVLPAGRWVLPEDWPLLATFAGFSGSSPLDITPSSVMAWDLNSGWVFNPTGENPDLCGVAAGVTGASGLLLGNASSSGASGLGRTSGAISGGAAGVGSVENIGPCFGQDATMLGTTAFYGTAPGSDPAVTTACRGGVTAGFGPFDATRSCTWPKFPLTYTPAGASAIGTTAAICGSAAAVPCLTPVRPDSTYLPNGTLNQWDAPMPAAQVSFGITSGPGYLGEVNKTGLYQLRFSVAPTVSGSTTTCPTGYTLVAGTAATATTAAIAATCQLELDPNPFYATAIPASPFIPPVTNNGGYLWNTFNFSAGITTVVRATPAFGASTTATFPAIVAGGFVPGQSTFVTFTAGATGVPAACPTLASAAGTTCTLPGGANLTGCTTAAGGTTTSVVVADARGFMPGMHVEVYSNTTGASVIGAGGTTGPVITAILPSGRTVGGTTYPDAAELMLSAAIPTCTTTTAPFTFTVIAQEFGLPVPGAAAFGLGQPVTLTTPSGRSTTVTVASNATGTTPTPLIDTTHNIVYVTGGEGIAGTLGPGCVLSRGTPGTFGTPPTFNGPAGPCEPAAIVPPGTVINSGPVGSSGLGTGALGARPVTLYPFWQWVPAAPSATATPTTATVYSDNHGEAVVTLNTAIATQTAPVAGVCPSPYQPIPASGTPVTCLLPFSVLGAAGFGNVATALSRFSAANPGCIQTFPSGTTAVLPGVTVGATGPAAGQICVNALGGIEFGSAAALGSTTVQAVADYPYTRGEHPMIAAFPLVKVFTSAFAKTLTVSAGTPGPAGTTSYTVTITALDVCGNPITGEPIQVYALGNAGAAVLAPVSAGAILQTSATSSVVIVDPNTGTATFSLEVLNTAIGTQGLVVKAVFPFERIERFATVISGSSTTSVTVVYAPGWQQIGGPTGSNFSVVEALFSWDAGAQSYANATASAGNLSSAAPGCTGYWGYFAAAMAVSLPATSKSGDTATCTLKSGWNLVGNPFGTPATLPSGVTAYHWNGTSYDTVGVIPTGGSVWLFNDGTRNSLTLTAT